MKYDLVATDFMLVPLADSISMASALSPNNEPRAGTPKIFREVYGS